MHIQLKFMGMLKDRTPENGELELANGSTIEDILQQLNVPLDSVQAFSLNGSIERDKERVLQDGDELTVLPPVGGG